MSADDLSLSDDMDQLKSMIRAMAAQASRADALEREIETLRARNADADERIKRLLQILKAYDRARFGRRSEKLGSTATDDEDAQQAFVFEEIETGISALRVQVAWVTQTLERIANQWLSAEIHALMPWNYQA